jgi:hypothetical protein
MCKKDGSTYTSVRARHIFASIASSRMRITPLKVTLLDYGIDKNERAHKSKSIIALPCSHAHPFTFSQPYTNTSMHIYSSNVTSEMSNVASAVWLHTSAAHLAFTCLLASMRRAPKARWCAHKHHKKYLARGGFFGAHVRTHKAMQPNDPPPPKAGAAAGYGQVWFHILHVYISYGPLLRVFIHSCMHPFIHPLILSKGLCVNEGATASLYSEGAGRGGVAHSY